MTSSTTDLLVASRRLVAVVGALALACRVIGSNSVMGPDALRVAADAAAFPTSRLFLGAAIVAAGLHVVHVRRPLRFLPSLIGVGALTLLHARAAISPNDVSAFEAAATSVVALTTALAVTAPLPSRWPRRATWIVTVSAALSAGAFAWHRPRLAEAVLTRGFGIDAVGPGIPWIAMLLAAGAAFASGRRGGPTVFITWIAAPVVPWPWSAAVRWSTLPTAAGTATKKD